MRKKKLAVTFGVWIGMSASMAVNLPRLMEQRMWKKHGWNDWEICSAF